jgi:polyphosphate kinase
VAVLVELKARFDEQANIAWARALEEAGVHVVYGLVGLKTHAKVGLVVRAEEDGIRRYCHVGTGNYNSETARLYEDLGVLSAEPALGADLTELFNFLTGYSRQSSYRRLILAPAGLRARIIELIGEEAAAGPDGRIIIKVNGLDDPAVMDALYRASQSGVPIDLITRGISCLRPGVPGLSETIQVRSIVGRFLEHSRIFSFGGVGGRPGTLLIGSADLRVRNLDRRIEAVVPVVDTEAQARLTEMLEVELADDTDTWVLGPDGSWSRLSTVEGVSAQRQLQELAVERARRRREMETLTQIRRP